MNQGYETNEKRESARVTPQAGVARRNALTDDPALAKIQQGKEQ
jgi:hypothetical protein